jgi:N-acetylmuramoyl-L-alanine amidase
LRRAATTLLIAALLACALLGACSSSSHRRAVAPSSTSTTHVTDTPSTVAPTTTATIVTTTTSVPARILSGRTIALDPGHNGGPVPPGTVYIGNGIRHPCDSTGTANRGGLTESALVLDVALRVRARLEALGANVLMTRTTDTGSGPCIDQRVEMANRAHVDVGLSIHADGTEGPRNAGGFHIAVPVLVPGQTQAVVDSSRRFALAVRAAYAAATGLPVSNYLGVDGILPRTDLANTNLPNHPRVLLELGVLNNASGGHDDMAVLGSDAGRVAMSRGIVDGIVRFLISS